MGIFVVGVVLYLVMVGKVFGETHERVSDVRVSTKG